jgi:hypothetical protein
MRGGQPYFDGNDVVIGQDVFGREFALMPGLSAPFTRQPTTVPSDCPPANTSAGQANDTGV